MNWLINLIDICDQRVQQNHYSPVSFQCIIYFVDGRRDTLDSFDALKSHSPIRQVMTSGFDLSFSYLVDFPGATELEKQDVRVRARSSFADVNIIKSSEASLYICVNCSNLTWGEDLGNHIIDHSRSIISDNFSIKLLSYVSRTNKLASMFLVVAIFVLFMKFGLPSGLNDFKGIDIEKIIDLPAVDPKALGVKIDALLEAAVSRSKSHLPSFLLYFPVFLLIPMFLPDLATYLLRTLARSFVILSPFTKEVFDKENNRNTRIKWIIIGACFTVPLGLIVATVKGYIFN